ncbi:hypothetical protein S7335_1616 [Synechococcus sp. PCC 7335]|nr:hypothetical protein S7335_1616 [Synechococcus sp. PCC 7335]
MLSATIHVVPHHLPAEVIAADLKGYSLTTTFYELAGEEI